MSSARWRSPSSCSIPVSARRSAALRQAALPAVSLATVGVLTTAGIFATATHYLTGFSWLESMLLGAAVASTDAAAVFFLLRAGNVHLRERVRSILEIESGTNDPIAIFLTITLVEVIARGADPAAEVLIVDLVVGFVVSMGIGAAVGLGGGFAIAKLVEKLDLDQGLLPIFVLALSLLVFAFAGAIGGSGFLAVYLAGFVAGNSRMRGAAILKRFQDGVSWLAQIIMFLVIGLFATPSQFPAILLGSVALGLFLIFVARPLAVWLCLLPFGFPRAETAFISWVGLRGAVSILLAITPLLYGLDHGREIFNIAFIIVLVSLIVQGWTVGWLARRLGLIVPARIGPLEKVELELPGSAHHELLAYTVVAGSPVARGERIPRWARPSLVVRNGRSKRFQDMGRLMAGDHVYIFVPDRYPRLLDRLFASRAEVDPEDADFFGAFAVDPAQAGGRPRSGLCAGPERDREEADDRRADAGSSRRPRRICRPRRAGADRAHRARCRRRRPHLGRRPLLRAGRDDTAHPGVPQRRRDRRPGAAAVCPVRQAGHRTAGGGEPQGTTRPARSPKGGGAAFIWRLASRRLRAKVRPF